MPTTFARLEYGKLCVSATGPILDHAESGFLAKTPDFPAPLRRFCTPSLPGPDADLDAVDAAERWGSSVLVVPVLLKAEIVRVGIRLRRRPEKGEQQSGRTFWRATFLCDGTAGTDLAALGAALAELPLLGWTEADVIEPVAAPAPLPGATAPGGLVPGLDPEQWVVAAAGFVTRGIPVGIVADLDAVRFFALAALVEAALPPDLRGLLSAGWGIAPARADQMALSCCQDFPPDVAVYDAAGHRWSHAIGDIGALRAARARGRHPVNPYELAGATRALRFDDPEVQRRVRDASIEPGNGRDLRRAPWRVPAPAATRGPPRVDPPRKSPSPGYRKVRPTATKIGSSAALGRPAQVAPWLLAVGVAELALAWVEWADSGQPVLWISRAIALSSLLRSPAAGLGLVWGMAATFAAVRAWAGARSRDALAGVRIVAFTGLLSVLVIISGSMLLGIDCLTCLGNYALVEGYAALVCWAPSDNSCPARFHGGRGPSRGEASKRLSRFGVS